MRSRTTNAGTLAEPRSFSQSAAMPSGLIALLDDVATLTKLAAASVDDIGAATVKAGTKAAGVVIDDTAVTPRYVIGLTPDRELPIIGKIAVGSLKNKLLILLPAAMLLAAFAPWGITPLLMLGGAYLAFEATEKIWEKVSGDHHDEAELLAADTPAELEARQVKGAIRTDFILSAEIMAIALASLDGNSLTMKGFALAVVAIAITVAVYGVVAIIVKLDDIGLHMAERRSRAAQAIGRGLVRGVPWLLTSLSGIGTAAMLWVGGGILLHGFDELGFETLPHFIHDWAHRLASQIGVLGGATEWLANALAAAVGGLIIGAILVVIVRRFTKHPEDYIVD
jgi:predicted DNA repair protein MutK